MKSNSASESLERPRAPKGGVMLEDKFYAGGEFLPEQYDDHRAARARRRQENAELEGFGKVRRPWGWVMSGDRVSVDGFVTNADGVVCGIHEKEIAVRLDDGTREWWPLWAIGLPNTSRAETVEANTQGQGAGQ